MRELPTGTVTFLFTDVEGSTRLLQELGERYSDALAEHRLAVRESIARHGGVEVDTQGDAFFVAFSRASDAIAAAEEIQRAEGPVRLRIGIHTGEPSKNAEGYVGIDVHRAARICSAGHGGQVLVSARTCSLVEEAPLRDLGLHRLKDLGNPVRLYQLGRTNFPPLRSLNQTNLPVQPTPFFGRERELAEAGSLLGEHRLLTLTGPGGTGKTRLALQIAAEAVEDFRDGAFWVPLAPLRDPELVGPTIAQGIGLRETPGATVAEMLREYLSGRGLLLLLDNFEQLMPAAPLLAEILAAAPEVKMLVTSRAALHLLGERELPVLPLPLSDSTALFVDRAQARAPDFRATSANTAALADICRRLDGLPLAIELAASRVRALSLEAIQDRLGHRLELLTGGARDLPERQQTLRATLDWSRELLGDRETTLLARLAVFGGGCTLGAAQAVCGDGMDVLSPLEGLVDHSLLRHRERDGDSRYAMLEIVREYAADYLEAGGESESMRRRHAEYYLALAEEAEPEFLRGDQVAALRRLEPEWDNFRAALTWMLEQDEAELALRLIGSLRRAWAARGYLSETRRWLEAALERPNGVSAPIRAKALYGLGRVALVQGDYAEAIPRLQESVELYRELEDSEGVVFSLADLGWIAAVQGDHARALALAEEGLAQAREASDNVIVSAALHSLACAHLAEGEYGQARKLFDESLGLRRRLGDNSNTANSLLYLGSTALLEGDYRGAATLLEESLAIARELETPTLVAEALAKLALVALFEGDAEQAVLRVREGLRLASEVGDMPTVVECLQAAAAIAAVRGDAPRAGTLSGAAETLHGVIEAPPSPAERAVAERFVDAARAELGEERFVEFLAQGRELSREEAVSLALREDA